MDPKKQECFGQFLYGAGYFSRDENTMSIAIVGRSAEGNFCTRCPRRKGCEEAHERRVRTDKPAAAEQYDRLVREGQRRGVPQALLKFLIGRDGRDPFAGTAVENFKRGHADRGQEAGTLITGEGGDK